MDNNGCSQQHVPAYRPELTKNANNEDFAVDKKRYFCSFSAYVCHVERKLQCMWSLNEKAQKASWDFNYFVRSDGN